MCMCVYTDICDINATISELPRGYLKVDSHFCAGDTIETYHDLAMAVSTCDGIPHCAGVYLYRCGKENKYNLCLSSSTIRVSYVGSCVYVRGSVLGNN